jgi:hypothetical protein
MFPGDSEFPYNPALGVDWLVSSFLMAMQRYEREAFHCFSYYFYMETGQGMRISLGMIYDNE